MPQDLNELNWAMHQQHTPERRNLLFFH
jgi:hypothetical protein